MSFQERLKRYSRPQDWADGRSSRGKVLEGWSARASSNSQLATRATDGKPLPSTGKIKLHTTSAAPSDNPKGIGGDPYAKAKRDLNSNGGSSFMRGVRRLGQ
jgi:hypothetical protein